MHALSGETCVPQADLSPRLNHKRLRAEDKRRLTRRRKIGEDVVIHEMIHLYIAFNGIKDSSSHGSVFRKMMNDINLKHGRNITVSTRTTKEQQDSDKRVRGHFLCIVKFSDGRLAVHARR